MARPSPLTYFEAAMGLVWMLGSLALGVCLVYFVLTEGVGDVGDVVVLGVLAVVFVLTLARSARDLSGLWAEVRGRLLVGPDGVQLDRSGEQRYAWSEIARFDAGDPTPDEDGLISVWATMHLHDGRRIQLPGLDHLLGGGGPYTRWKIAKISEHVATLNRLRDDNALGVRRRRPPPPAP